MLFYCPRALALTGNHVDANNAFLVPYIRLQLKLHAEISIEYATETTNHKTLSHVSD